MMIFDHSKLVLIFAKVSSFNLRTINVQFYNCNIFSTNSAGVLKNRHFSIEATLSILKRSFNKL